MPDLSSLLGQRLRRPDSFFTDRALCDSYSTYHLDFEQRIVRRTRLSDLVEPIAYFELILDMDYEPEEESFDVPQSIIEPAAIIPNMPVAKAQTIEPEWIDFAPEYYYDQPIPAAAPQDHLASNYATATSAPKRRNLKWLRGVLSTIAALAVVLLLYPLYPGVRYHAQQIVSQTLSHSDALASAPAVVSASVNEVVIPKIGIRTNILEAPSLAILDHKEGVWHQTGDASSNLVLAGHRWKYLPPNTSTLYNLGQLVPGDSIIVDWQGTRIIYAVTNVETVTASQVGILNQDHGPRLTIYTCSDKRESRRIVVHADIVP